MKKFASFALSIVLTAGMFLIANEQTLLRSVHSCVVSGIDGEQIEFSRYKGKVLLMVNVASQCGATSQYDGLQALSEKFQDRGLVVMAFPSNDFGGQEPGSNAEIKAFCSQKFSVTFPLFAKGPVKGSEKSPLFEYLTTAINPDRTGEIGWNFEKFLVGRDGTLLRRFSTSVDPSDPDLLEAVEKALAAGPQ